MRVMAVQSTISQICQTISFTNDYGPTSVGADVDLHTAGRQQTVPKTHALQESFLKTAKSTEYMDTTDVKHRTASNKSMEQPGSSPGLFQDTANDPRSFHTVCSERGMKQRHLASASQYIK